MAAKPRKVDWLDSDDLKVVIMGQMGMSTQAIVRATGLTECQVMYRLNKSNTLRSEYRNGTSEMAKRVLDRMTPSDATIRGIIRGQTTTTKGR